MTRQVYTWSSIAAVVIASCAGDVWLSHAMKQVGDVGELWRRTGILTVAGRIIRNPQFVCGVLCMTLAFYSLLFALSWDDVSLIGPAAAALTFIANAIAAKIFLREKVDRRRWIAALLVAGGVVLLAR
jgi:drug/metabolite transporter (DMT)-like permease